VNWRTGKAVTAQRSQEFGVKPGITSEPPVNVFGDAVVTAELV
jgi:hypothetical protein